MALGNTVQESRTVTRPLARGLAVLVESSGLVSWLVGWLVSLADKQLCGVIQSAVPPFQRVKMRGDMGMVPDGGPPLDELLDVVCKDVHCL